MESLLKKFFNDENQEYEVFALGDQNFLELLSGRGMIFVVGDALWEHRIRDQVLSNGAVSGCTHDALKHPCFVKNDILEETFFPRSKLSGIKSFIQSKHWIYKGRWIEGVWNDIDRSVFQFTRYNLFEPDTMRWSQIDWKSDEFLSLVEANPLQETEAIRRWVCGIYIKASGWIRYSDHQHFIPEIPKVISSWFQQLGLEKPEIY
jgi:hypothetical protein